MRRPVPVLAVYRLGLVCMVFLTGLSGCWRDPNQVTGIVRFEGQPLPVGRVTFLCEGVGRPVISGNLSSDGSYVIANPPVGTALISVEAIKPPPKPKPGVDPVYGVDYEAEWIAEWGNAGPYVPIPSRYASPTSSGLEVTIGPGEQTFDIDLTQ